MDIKFPLLVDKLRLLVELHWERSVRSLQGLFFVLKLIFNKHHDWAEQSLLFIKFSYESVRRPVVFLENVSFPAVHFIWTKSAVFCIFEARVNVAKLDSQARCQARLHKLWWRSVLQLSPPPYPPQSTFNLPTSLKCSSAVQHRGPQPCLRDAV